MRQNLIPLILCVLIALMVRLPDLTAFITADEARSWFGRTIIFTEALSRAEWGNTAPGSDVDFIENLSLSPAPGVTTMWAGTFGILLDYTLNGTAPSLAEYLRTIPFDPLDPAILFYLRLPNVFISTLTVALTFWWTRRWLGTTGAFITATLLALDPFYLALSRILGHDGFVATFMWLSILCLINYLHTLKDLETPHISRLVPTQERGNESKFPTPNPQPPIPNPKPQSPKTFLLLSGFWTGLAVMSKYPALFLGAFTGLMLVIAYFTKPDRSPRPVRFARVIAVDLTLWSAVMGGTALLIWPALWVDPFGVPINILSDALRASGNPHQKGSFFLGQPVPDPGMLYYPLVALWRSSPLVWLGLLGGFGLWLIQRRQLERSSLIALSVGILFIALYGLLITFGGKKQDRYLLPIFPALTLLTGLGYSYLLQSVGAYSGTPNTKRASILQISASGLIVLLGLTLIGPTHPYYFSYYNPLLGGAAGAAQTIQVGWGEGLNEAAAYLNSVQEPDQPRRGVSWYSTTFEPYFAGETIYKIDEAKISRNPKPGLAADYVVLYINQLQRRLPSEGGLAFFQQSPSIHTVRLGNLDYAQIYPAPAVRHIFPPDTRLVGQADLLGFDWLADDGTKLDAVPSNGVTTLRLYWEWQGKVSDEPIGISLVDNAGRTVGWGTEIGSTEDQVMKQEGAIIKTAYAMAVFPGTPPEGYALKSWIDRPATGELVGQFPNAMPVTIGRPAQPTTAEDFEIGERTALQFEGLELFGFNPPPREWQPNEPYTFELFWHVTDKLATETTVSLCLSDSTDTETLVSTLLRGKGLCTDIPTQERGNERKYAWQVGDRYRQYAILTVPPHIPPDEYAISLSVAAIQAELTTLNLAGRPRQFEVDDPAETLSAQFGETIGLLGYELAQGDHELAVTLYWQAIERNETDYTVFVQLLDSANQVVAQRDSQPLAGGAPTTTWTPLEIIEDRYRLEFNPQGGQNYTLIAGFYDPATGQRLPLNTVGDTSAMGDAVVVAVVE